MLGFVFIFLFEECDCRTVVVNCFNFYKKENGCPIKSLQWKLNEKSIYF